MAIDYRRRSARPRRQAVREHERRAAARGRAAAWRRLVVLLAALAASRSPLRLGFWQLDRAAQKVALQATLEHARRASRRSTRPTLARDAAGGRRRSYHRRGPPARHTGSPSAPSSSTTGRWTARSASTSSRRLRLEGRREAVLVQRGWAPRNFDQRDAAAAGGHAAGPGRGRRPHRPAAVAAVRVRRRRERADPAKSRPRLVRARDRARRCCRWRCIAEREPSARPRRPRATWPPPATDVQKHYGYAFQWFALARGDRRPLCLVPIHPPPPAPPHRLTRRAAELHASTRCRRREAAGGRCRAHRARPLEDARSCCWSAPRR